MNMQLQHRTKPKRKYLNALRRALVNIFLSNLLVSLYTRAVQCTQSMSANKHTYTHTHTHIMLTRIVLMLAGNGNVAVAIDTGGASSGGSLVFRLDRNDAWVPATGDISCCG